MVVCYLELCNLIWWRTPLIFVQRQCKFFATIKLCPGWPPEVNYNKINQLGSLKGDRWITIKLTNWEAGAGLKGDRVRLMEMTT